MNLKCKLEKVERLMEMELVTSTDSDANEEDAVLKTKDLKEQQDEQEEAVLMKSHTEDFHDT
jgi:hypothetical protein